MKKIVILFSTFIFISISTFGQLTVGLKLGYSPYSQILGLDKLVTYNTAAFKNTENVSNPGLTYQDGSSLNKNISISATANYAVNRFLQLNAELGYFQTGGKVVYRFNKEIVPNANTTYHPVQSNAQLNYVSLPVTGRFTYGLDSSILKIYVEAGAYAGLLVGRYSAQPESRHFLQSGEVKIEPPVGGTANNTTWLANENFSAIDFGLVFGGGFQFEVGPGMVDIGAKYMYGLADVWGGPGTAVLNNRFINVSAGYLINLSALSGKGTNQFKNNSDSSTPQ